MNTNIHFQAIKNTRWLSAWMRAFCPAGTLHRSGLRKRCGVSTRWLLQLFLVLPFVDLTVYRLSGITNSLPHRSTFYAFLNKASYNWRLLLMQVALSVILQFDRLTDARQDRVFIVDDSPYKRPRSKKVEYLGHHYDHSNGTYYRGYRMLTMAWSDGHSLVPVDFELLTNADADKRLAEAPAVDRRTQLGRRCRGAVGKATGQTRHMVERALAGGIQADYLVFDSWFAHPGLLHELHQHLPVVCMLKKSSKISYRRGKRIYQLKGLYEKVQARCKSTTGEIIGSVVVHMLSGPRVRIVFVRDRRNPQQWLALACTDTQIKTDRICRIYSKRWAIEVFFKQAKQQLGLAGEFQMRSYAGLIAHTSIVCLRYMMLEYYRRQCTDERTIPGLFHDAVQQLQYLCIQACIRLVLLEIMTVIARHGQAEVLGEVIAVSRQYYPQQSGSNLFPVAHETFNLKSES